MRYNPKLDLVEANHSVKFNENPIVGAFQDYHPETLSWPDSQMSVGKDHAHTCTFLVHVPTDRNNLQKLSRVIIQKLLA